MYTKNRALTTYNYSEYTRAYLRGGGFRGFHPPPEIFRFFLKSEGKEVERKKYEKGWGGGVNC